MVKFKSIYKSEYNKILGDYEEEKNKEEYVFHSRVNKEYTEVYTTFSSRSRNKNERFENELICKK